jgi:hypothetical protein
MYMCKRYPKFHMLRNILGFEYCGVVGLHGIVVLVCFVPSVDEIIGGVLYRLDGPLAAQCE